MILTNIMLDLETLDTRPTAVVLSIGAIAFDPLSETLGDPFYVELSDLPVQQLNGRTISASTVQWWMQQDVLAKRVFSDAGTNRRNTMAGLSDFQQYIAANGGKNAEIWGNGADFDNIILGSLYDSTNMTRPWSYSRNRCFRTMKSLFPHVKVPHEGVAHNALDDAITQAKWLQAIMKEIRSVERA